MRLHVYAFVRGQGRPEIAGIRRAPVRFIAAGGRGGKTAALGALASSALWLPRPRSSDVLAHDRVTRDALGRFESVVPVRFGCTEEADRLAALLCARRREIKAEADRLAGTVEFALRIVRARPPAGDGRDLCAGSRMAAGGPGAGARYLERKLAAGDISRLRARVAPIRERLGSLARAVEESTRRSERYVEIALCFLAERGRAVALQSALAEIAAEEGDGGETCVLWSGPWAPYSFVRLHLAGDVLGESSPAIRADDERVGHDGAR